MNLLDYKIKNPDLLKEIFTHKSAPNATFNNERLEFLGDAILNLVIAEDLMTAFPQDTEGDLTKKRSQLVSGQTLWEMALDLNLHQSIQVGPNINIKEKKIMAGVLEAYIGGIYLDSDFLTVQQILKKLFQKHISNHFISVDYKSSLQEWCQKKYKTIPLYKIKKEEGPDHKKIFYVDVFINKKYIGSGSNYQKKQAEQMAAKQAIKELKISV